MKVYGYSLEDDDSLLSMGEVSIQATPNELRKISSFLLKCAEDLEKNDDFDHEHFQDFAGATDNDPDLIIVSPNL